MLTIHYTVKLGRPHFHSFGVCWQSIGRWRGQRARGAPLGCSQPRAPAPRACATCTIASELEPAFAHPYRFKFATTTTEHTQHAPGPITSVYSQSRLCISVSYAWMYFTIQTILHEGCLFIYLVAQTRDVTYIAFERHNECFRWINDRDKRMFTFYCNVQDQTVL